MAREMRSAIIATAISALAGCGDSEIDTVKNSFYSDAETVSMGNLLDNRHICSSVTWDVFETEQNTNTVEYRCYLSGAKDYFIQKLEQEKLKHDQRETSRLERLRDEFQDKSNKVELAEKNILELEIKIGKLQETITLLQKELLENTKPNATQTTENALHKLELLTQNITHGEHYEYQIQNALLSPSKLIGQVGRYSAINHNDWKKTERQLLEKSKALIKSKGNKANAELLIKRTNDEIPKIELKIKSFTKSTFRGTSDYKDMYELWQWGFNKDGIPILTYGGYELIKPNNTSQSLASEPRLMFRYAKEEDPNINFNQYQLRRLYNL
jgi:hypothetical protein